MKEVRVQPPMNTIYSYGVVASGTNVERLEPSVLSGPHPPRTYSRQQYQGLANSVLYLVCL